jgi:dCMP deaminase
MITRPGQNVNCLDYRAAKYYYYFILSGRRNMDNRTSKENYYLDIADSVLERSTCLRRMYGAIIVLNDEIISTGYNGAPRGRKNCSDLGRCAREELNIPSGERYELCRSVHAEANAIISAARRDMIGATLYLVGRDARTRELLPDAMSCAMCKKLIINSGIKKVVIRVGEDRIKVVDVEDWIINDDSLFIKL